MNKKFLSLLMLTALLGVTVTGCTAATGQASSWPGYTISEEVGFFAYGPQVYALDLKNGSQLWRYPQESGANRQFFAAPALGEDILVVGDYANTLVALDAANGTEKWSFKAADDRYIASALVFEGSVFAPNTDHYLYALDETGSLVWRFETQGPNWTKPMTDGKKLYMISMDHYLYAFNLEYVLDRLTEDKDGSRTLLSEPEWSLDLGAAVTADPVLADGFIYAGTLDGTLYAVDLSKQAIAWSFDADDGMTSLWGNPVLTADTVYIGDETGNVYAVSKTDGKALWPAPFAAGSSLISGGVALEDQVIFATKAGKVFSINTNKEPRTLATFDSPIYATLKIAGDKLIIAPANKEALFKAIDINGNETWGFLPND